MGRAGVQIHGCYLWQASKRRILPRIECVSNSPQTHDAVPAEAVLLGLHARQRS